MPLCEGCGASYEDSYKFCPHCGRAKPEKVEHKLDHIDNQITIAAAQLRIQTLENEIKELDKRAKRELRELDQNASDIGVLKIFFLKKMKTEHERIMNTYQAKITKRLDEISHLKKVK
jgi:predicted  nucleic acid-binding Zn-ribbon protein